MLWMKLFTFIIMGLIKQFNTSLKILRLFSESAKSISVDMADAKKLLGSHNKQLHQLWYHSLSLRHALALLDQIESVSKVPAEIEKLILDKQFYAAVQLQVQTMLVLERGLQVALASIPSINSEAVQQRLDNVRTY
ncbi:exocyst complex component SEC8-like [Zingiber officinale]|uniref:exocyst complex component SEC8-like n=1 Tax=Zingiber officinale TaxID=94328 RepID=UPI001C4BB97C|nr:exocyst complex component SEC8-like [Zingiber officinale]